MSPVKLHSTWVRFSFWMAWRSEPALAFASRSSLVIQVLNGLVAITCSARSQAASGSRSAGTTAVTSPAARASAAPIFRPVSSISAARLSPIRRGRRQVMPISPPDTPILTLAATNTADSDATRMSAASARANPPPAAAPLTAAMTATGSSCRRRATPASRRCPAISAGTPRSAGSPL
jgi:hypothetical protein